MVMHGCGYVHGDVKPENILYNPINKDIKLIDFNVSKRIKKRKIST